MGLAKRTGPWVRHSYSPIAGVHDAEDLSVLLMPQFGYSIIEALYEDDGIIFEHWTRNRDVLM